MINFYFKLFIIVFFPLSVFAQNSCDEANSRISYAYSHIKKAHSSRSIDGLKYFSKRSKETLDNSKDDLEKCGCKVANEKALNAIEFLAKVATKEVYEDARFFMNHAKDILNETMTSIDECSYGNESTVSNVNQDVSIITNNQTSKELHEQQIALRKQQDLLKLQEEKLKQQLISQQLKRNRALITHYKAIIASNVKTFNESLSSMSCSIKTIDLSPTDTTPKLEEKDTKEISKFYKTKLQTLTNEYLALLHTCN